MGPGLDIASSLEDFPACHIFNIQPLHDMHDTDCDKREHLSFARVDMENTRNHELTSTIRTTNDLTSNISQGIAKAFGLVAVENVIELVVRAVS